MLQRIFIRGRKLYIASYGCRDSFMRETSIFVSCLMHMCGMIHLYVCHDSFVYVT